MHRCHRFPCRVSKASSRWLTTKKVDEAHAKVESWSRTKLPATFKHSRVLRCPRPSRAQQSCHQVRNLPILSGDPPNLHQPSSRNLRVPLHPTRQPTRMLLPKIALHTIIHRSSHFLHLHRIGSPRHRGTSANILPSLRSERRMVPAWTLNAIQ